MVNKIKQLLKGSSKNVGKLTLTNVLGNYETFLSKLNPANKADKKYFDWLNKISVKVRVRDQATTELFVELLADFPRLMRIFDYTPTERAIILKEIIRNFDNVFVIVIENQTDVLEDK